MSDSLQDRIVKLIPSKDLRNVIAETGYILSDTALLQIAYHCAPDFASRIEHLRMLESAFTGKIKAYITKIIETQQQMLDGFLKNENAVVFELHIKEAPDACDETYLCSCFDAAMKMIPLFYQEYGGEETASSRYHIVKRRVFSASEGEAFAEDYLGDMQLLPGGVVYTVDMDGVCAEDCDSFCWECDRYCVRRIEIPLPRFTNHGDLVKYRDHDGTDAVGVVLQWDDAPTGECYIIPLDCEQIRYHDFNHAHYSHEHILSVFVEKIPVDCLSADMKDDCLAYLAFLKDNFAWG